MATKVTVQSPQRVERMILPFQQPVGGLLPAGSGDLVAWPQAMCRPQRLYLPHDIAHVLSISEIRVGAHSYLLSDGYMPGSSFCERRNPKKTDLLIDWPTISPAQRVLIQVHNRSSKPIPLVEAYLTCLVVW